ncbi:hypothetical protein FACS189425_05730 [Clostridia bacterium]|nr:hypothetical protein FACS189425_05730 [Clostridia bacterium]
MNEFDFLSAMLKQFFETEPERERRSEACPLCGTTARAIRETGRLGCSRCYEHFEFGDYLQKLSGQTAHRGKIPASAGAEVRAKRRASEIKDEMAAAVKEQNFERAAVLRDELKALEVSAV